MQQVIVLLFIAIFGDGEISSHSTIFPTMAECESSERLIWNQTSEVYAESDVVGMFSECIVLVTRDVPE